jgi:excisionase family DNA binding protein
MRSKKAKRFYTTGDVARYCEVDVNTVKRWIRRGSLEAFSTPSGHYRIARDRFIAFIKEQGFTYDPAYFGDGQEPADILIVANDTLQLEALTNLLTHANGEWIIETAANDFDGYRKIHHCRPRLMIMNLTPSDHSGLEFLRVVRSKDDFQELKILIVADALEPEIETELEALHVDAILTEPLTTRNLRMACEEFFSDLKVS